MSRPLFVAGAAAILMTLGACASGTYADVARFHSNQPINRGTIYLQPADPAMAQSLEFRTHSETVAVELRRLGFQTVPTPEQAQYLATIDLGQTDGRSSLNVQIKRASDQAAVWEGRASVANPSMTTAVPQLAGALFRGFPGTPGVTTQVPV